MRKDRVAYFRKRLVDKQRQLVEEVGRNALYGKDKEDDSIKDLGDQANTAYTREFLFELGNGDRRRVVRQLRALRRADFRPAIGGAAVRAALYRLSACRRTGGADGGGITRRSDRRAPRRLVAFPPFV
jgi:hypothetical protein